MGNRQPKTIVDPATGMDMPHRIVLLRDRNREYDHDRGDPNQWVAIRRPVDSLTPYAYDMYHEIFCRDRNHGEYHGYKFASHSGSRVYSQENKMRKLAQWPSSHNHLFRWAYHNSVNVPYVPHEIVEKLIRQKELPHAWFPGLCQAYAQQCKDDLQAKSLLSERAMKPFDPPVCDHVDDYKVVRNYERLVMMKPEERFLELKANDMKMAHDLALNIARQYNWYEFSIPTTERLKWFVNAYECIPSHELWSTIVKAYATCLPEQRPANLLSILADGYELYGSLILSDDRDKVFWVDNNAIFAVRTLDYALQTCNKLPFVQCRFLLQQKAIIARDPLMLRLIALLHETKLFDNAIECASAIIQSPHEWKTPDVILALTIRSDSYAAKGTNPKQAAADREAITHLQPTITVSISDSFGRNDTKIQSFDTKNNSHGGPPHN